MFSGTAMCFPSDNAPLSGKFVIQAKHTASPTASCADAEFNRILRGEHPKILALIATGDIDHYLVFTNRKKPAISTEKKEKELNDLNLKTAHIIGIEQIRLWLTQHPSIWSRLGFDRFDAPLRIQTDDITSVVKAFHDTLDGTATHHAEDFTYVPKPQKNKINKLSAAYFEEIRTRSLPYFKTIEDFLSNPRNIDFKDMYEDTADEIRRKLLLNKSSFDSFDAALTHIIDLVTTDNAVLERRRRFATIFLHYMYYTCDIGQHVSPIEAS